MLSKTFTVEFLTFNGIDTTCKLCNEKIRDNQEEVVIPVIYFDKQCQGGICDECYKALLARVRESRLPSFGG